MASTSMQSPLLKCMDPKDMCSSFAPPSPPCSSSTSQSDPSSLTQSSVTSSKKKRKSWGQVLPKPTTNLPPRKRAKTDEEKAQRLYERVQRNRQAAHNSRMRKQDEMEDVQRENCQLKQQNDWLEAEVQRLSEANKSLNDKLSQVSPPSDLPTPGPVTLSSSSNAFPVSTPPSLTSGSSADDEPHSLPSPQFYTPPASDGKPFNDTHSAVMCHTQQWTLNAQAVSMGGTGPPIKT